MTSPRPSLFSHSSLFPLLLLVFLLPAIACSGGESGTDSDDNPEDQDTDSEEELPEDETSDPSAPRILSLNLSSPRLDELGQVTVSAIVTDPDGISDLIGGELKSVDGSTFGAFATASDEGAYSMTITWNDVKAVRQYNFGEEGKDIVLTAIFFDQAGHYSTRSLTLHLACSETELTACESECVNLSEDEDHCGSCDASVYEIDGANHCFGGEAFCGSSDKIVCGDECVYARSEDLCGACDHSCTEIAGQLSGIGFGPETTVRACAGTNQVRDSFCVFYYRTFTMDTCDNICAGIGQECIRYAGNTDCVADYGTTSRRLDCGETPSATVFDGESQVPFDNLTCICAEIL